MRRATKVLFIVSLIILMVCPPASAKKVLLKVPVCFNTSLPVIGDSAVWLADMVGTASGGGV